MISISDKLYSLAYEFRKTKLWEIIAGVRIFAVKLSNGSIGYIELMNDFDNHHSLNLFIAESGFRSMRILEKADEFSMSPFQFQEAILQQQCLQCVFVGKDEMEQDELEKIREFARNAGIKIAGKNPYPLFRKYRPYHYPWQLQSEQEQKYMCEAFQAAIKLSQLIKEKAIHQYDIESVNNTKTIRTFQLEQGEYILGQTDIPHDTREEYPTPRNCNDISIAKLKKAKRQGVWECEIVHYPEPFIEEQKDIPVYPTILFAVENTTGYILPIAPVANYEDEPEELLNLFMEALLLENVCPKEMKVRDEKTYAFAGAWCERLRIKITIDENLTALDEVENDYMNHFNMNENEELQEVEDMLNDISEMDEEQLKEIPQAIINQLNMLIDSGILPEYMKEKMKCIFNSVISDNSDNSDNSDKFGNNIADRSRITVKKGKTIKKATTEETEKQAISKQSYVISVSLGTGCYRHIKISKDYKLIELHWAILDAFGFDDDHAHAFFMDNKAWSERDCYYVKGIESYYRTTEKYRLNEIGLHNGKQFKYIFDFGDEWIFQCKVLRIEEGSADTPIIVRSKGEAPKQYEDFDDEWDDEED